MRGGRTHSAIALALALLLMASMAEASTFSKRANGTKVLYLLLADLGYRVSRIFSVDALSQRPESPQVAVLVGQLRTHQANKARSWVENGGTLVLALPLMDETGHCKDISFGSMRIKRTYRFDKERTARAVDDRLLVRETACVATAPRSAAVLASTQDGAVAFEITLGKGRILMLSHDDLLSNLVLDKDDITVIMRRWIARNAAFGSRIGFLEQRAGGALWQMLKRAKMLPLALHALLFLVLLYWRLAPRFGDTDPFVPAPRRAFAEHARTLGSLYQRVGASGRVLAARYERFLGRLRLQERQRHHRRSEAADADDASRLATLIATRTGRDATMVERVLRRTEVAISQEQKSTPKLIARDFALARGLDDLVQSYEGRAAARKTKGKTG